MIRLFQRTGAWIGNTWCHLTHPAPMWPVAGYYQCRLCQRRFRVKFELPLADVAKRETIHEGGRDHVAAHAAAHAEASV